MGLIDSLGQRWKDVDHPVIMAGDRPVTFAEIVSQQAIDLSVIGAGDVVAIIGDFNPPSILTLLRLIDMKTVVVPLTVDTRHDHEYFFDAALVDVVIENGEARRRQHKDSNPLLEELRQRDHAGLVLFSTGTTGRPKAILHDMSLFLKRFETPRPTLRTINFLLFDHIGGINTLLHTLFNTGVVICPEARTVASILQSCREHQAEVLPTTPTFLRMMLMSGAVPDQVPPCLKIITYGTERMDQGTLDTLCTLLPDVDFRQTFGMSELGIVRVKSRARDSLFMKVGGEGVETRCVGGVLQIRSSTRMLGYLNAESPFDVDGWYDTKDVVVEEDGYYKVVGRIGEVINVGGLKFMASEVEQVALEFPGVALVKASGRSNPITGQHVELTVQPTADAALEKAALSTFLKERLPGHMVPRRVSISDVEVGHRYKRL